MTGYVYLIHFDQPVTPGHPCRHYVGYADNLASRIQSHETGGKRAARLMQVVKARAISWRVASVWRGDRSFERSLKDRKATPRYCPVCTPGVKPFGDQLTQHEIDDCLMPF